MKSPTHHGCGFSLIELMCSMGVGTILLLAAAAVLGSYGVGYQRVGGDVASEREARAAISCLAADLASARYHPHEVLETSGANWPLSRLGFLCLQSALAQSDAGRIGDLCAVHYAIQDLTFSGKTVRCLMRGCRDSRDTFQALEAHDLEALFAANCRLDEPVAIGVVSFVARPRSRDLAGRWIAWVENDAVAPEALEVLLVLARRDLTGHLRTSEDWDGASAAAKLLGEPSAAAHNPGLEVYQAVIQFGNHENTPMPAK